MIEHAIPYDPEFRKSEDFRYLRSEGISLLQKLTGSIWTDFNLHDPGITMLETMCFNLTDLAYRTGRNHEQLFLPNPNDKVENENTLFKASSIFSNAPVTYNDFRILIIDQVEEVLNAWVFADHYNKLGIKGLLNIRLKIENDKDEKLKAEVIAKVEKLFHQNRNLGEDLNEIKVIESKQVKISATIDVLSETFGEDVAAEVLYKIESYFNSNVHFKSLDELVDRGVGLEDIYNTPSFINGFLDQEELLALTKPRTTFYQSKIKELILSITGVYDVRNLQIKIENEINTSGEIIEIKNWEYLTINIEQTELGIYKSGLKEEYDVLIAEHLCDLKREDERKINLFKDLNQPTEHAVFLDKEKAAAYGSVQYDLPWTYKVGRYIYDQNNSKKGPVYSSQLQAYLYFFDQILYNHLQQLVNINQTFSISSSAPERSYFGGIPPLPEPTQALIDFKEEASFYAFYDQFDHYQDRKNKVLEHLLGRFGVRLADNFDQRARVIFGSDSETVLKDSLIDLKKNYLRNFESFSRSRFSAQNYKVNCWGVNEDSKKDKVVPTLKRQMYLLLNITGLFNRSLTEHMKGFSTKSSRKPANEGSTRIKIKLKKKDYMIRLLSSGCNKESYRFEDGNLYLDIEDKQHLMGFDLSQEDANQKIKNLLNFFKEKAYLSEGFHMVEHVLLRPRTLEYFRFKIVDTKEKPVFESIELGKEQNMKMLAEDVLIWGCKRNNYKVQQAEVDKFSLVILHPDSKVALVRSLFYAESASEAQSLIDQYVKYFLKIDKEQRSLQEIARIESVTKQGKKGNNPMLSAKDFYNNTISLVMPNWVPRFQKQNFKYLFKIALSSCLPAHIRVNVAWLDIGQMKAFEKAFVPWQEQNAMENMDVEKMDEYSLKIAEILIKSK